MFGGPSYLFPFGARISFEAGESWGTLQEEVAGSGWPPNPSLHHRWGSSSGRHSPWGRVVHRGLGIPGGLVHPETQPVPRVSRAPPIPVPMPPTPRPPQLTHHRARNPSQAIRPGLPRGPLGANGASLPRRAFQAGFSLQGGRRTQWGPHAALVTLAQDAAQTPQGALVRTPDTPR